MQIVRPLVFITPASADAVTTLIGIDTTKSIRQEVTEEVSPPSRRAIPRPSEEENDTRSLGWATPPSAR